MLALVAFSLTALGYVIAWKMDSTQGFHAIMNLSSDSHVAAVRRRVSHIGRSRVVAAVMNLNPLTYGMSAVRWSIYGTDVASTMDLPGFALSIGVTVAFAALIFGAAIRMTRRPV